MSNFFSLLKAIKFLIWLMINLYCVGWWKLVNISTTAVADEDPKKKYIYNMHRPPRPLYKVE